MSAAEAEAEIPEGCCPKCSRRVPEDSVWLAFGRFYCSEGCARGAVAPVIRLFGDESLRPRMGPHRRHR